MDLDFKIKNAANPEMKRISPALVVEGAWCDELLVRFLSGGPTGAVTVEEYAVLSLAAAGAKGSEARPSSKEDLEQFWIESRNKSLKKGLEALEQAHNVEETSIRQRHADIIAVGLADYEKQKEAKIQKEVATVVAKYESKVRAAEGDIRVAEAEVARASQIACSPTIAGLGVVVE